MAMSVGTWVSLSSAFLAANCWSAAQAGERSDWFESLKMPGTIASCCGLGDCHRADADWRKGQWWAVVDGEWRPVPKSQVLTSPPSIDGAAYVCTGTPSWAVDAPLPAKSPIYCFVPPNWPS